MSNQTAPKPHARHSGESRNPAPLAHHEEWSSRRFVDALSNEKPPRRGKLQARDYKPSGVFPVIDQGQNEIAGWTSDDSLVIKENLPYIVFGDHTRAFKFVDKPFALGADGTQLLKPSTDYCPRFFYYACLQLDLPSHGYNRHYTFLKEKSLPLPPKPEQQKIAAVLRKMQRAIATQDCLIAATRDLKQSAMQRFFTHGLRGEGTRETPYGDVPLTWREQPLGDCCHVQTGVTKGRKIAPEDALEVPYLRVANVQDGHLDLREIKTITIRARELSGYRLQDGDVVLTEGGDFDQLGRGFIWRGQIKDCVHQNHVFAVRANRDLLAPEFLAYLVQSPYGKNYFLTVAHKTTNLASINSTKLKALPVLLPDLAEQRDIAAALATIDRKLAHHQQKRAALNDLFQTTLHQLMTAQIRVADLDIDISEVTAPSPQGATA